MKKNKKSRSIEVRVDRPADETCDGVSTTDISRLRTNIKINESAQGQQTVNARELHSYLDSKQDFSTWIKKRINKYDFIENEDFIRLHKKMEANNANVIEYHISIDMAKELSILENNEQGRQARRYFINAEKALKSQSARALPSNYKEAVEALLHQIELNDEYKEDAIYANTVLQSQRSYTTTRIANELGMSPIALNKFLKKHRVIRKHDSSWILYAQYQGLGYAETITVLFNHSDGTPDSNIQLRWTEKGRKFIHELFKDNYSPQPVT